MAGFVEERFGALWGNDEDVFEPRGFEHFDLATDRIVFDDGEFWRGVAEDELPIAFCLDFVHGHDNGAEPIGGISGECKWHAVIGNDGDAIALFDAIFFEQGADAQHFYFEFAVGHPAIGAVDFFAQKGAVGVARSRVVDEFSERFDFQILVIMSDAIEIDFVTIWLKFCHEHASTMCSSVAKDYRRRKNRWYPWGTAPPTRAPCSIAQLSPLCHSDMEFCLVAAPPRRMSGAVFAPIGANRRSRERMRASRMLADGGT